MPRWTIVAPFTVEADDPDQALARVRGELAVRLQSGEEGSPWQPDDGGGTPPQFVVGSIRRVADDPGVPARRREG